MYEYSA